MKTWTNAELFALPPIIDVPTAGSIFRIGRTNSHQQVREGTFPVRVLRVGRRYRVPTADVIKLLGLENSEAGTAIVPALATTDSPHANGVRRDQR